MLWWFDDEHVRAPRLEPLEPATSTRTPVVVRISRDHVRAHQCAKYPRVSNRLEHERERAEDDRVHA